MLKFKHQSDMTDLELLELHDRAKQEGILRLVFDAASPLHDGLNWLSYVQKSCWLVLVSNEEGPQTVFWLDGFRGDLALFNYWSYRCAWGKTERRIEEVFSWLKANCPIKYLLGYTPEANRLAVRMLKKAGFEVKFAIEDNLISYRRL